MQIEEGTIQLLIFIHAIFAGIALLSGFLAIVSKKGAMLHRRSGIVFVITMLLSNCISFVISTSTTHRSYFLICIAIFSTYFVVGGYRALSYKRESTKLTLDYCVSVLMLIAGLAMVLNPLYFGKLNLVLFIFGIVGLSFSIRDLLVFRDRSKLARTWLKTHLGKITGGYISAVTAFIVVNQFIEGIIGWIAPGIIGTFFIAYWMRKVTSGDRL